MMEEQGDTNAFSQDHGENAGEGKNERHEMEPDEEREDDEDEELLDPRQLVVTILSARDVPLNMRAPNGW